MDKRNDQNHKEKDTSEIRETKADDQGEQMHNHPPQSVGDPLDEPDDFTDQQPRSPISGAFGPNFRHVAPNSSDLFAVNQAPPQNALVSDLSQHYPDQELLIIQLEKRNTMPAPHAPSQSRVPPTPLPDLFSIDSFAKPLFRLSSTSRPPSDFKKLVKTVNYVDNSEAVSFLHADPSRKIEIIQFPHGWGKTTLLTTMKAFYAKAELGPDGVLASCDNIDTIRDLFSDTTLCNNEFFEAIKGDLGSFFVVHLDFKEFNGISLERFEEYIYLRNSQIILSNAITEEVLGKLSYQTFKDQASLRLKNYNPFQRLVYLIETIATYYGVPSIILLIDNFDGPSLTPFE